MLKRSALDTIAGVPSVIAYLACSYWKIEPVEFVIFFLSFSVITGLSLWGHTINYKIKENENVNFTQNSNKLRD